MSIKKDLIPREESLELKELGFNEPCMAWISKKGEVLADIILGYEDHYDTLDSLYINSDMGDGECANPTFSQAFRWFREAHGWQHSIDAAMDQQSHQLGYNYWIWNYKTGEEYHTIPRNRPKGAWEFESYGEAELACLRELITIVKNEIQTNQRKQ